MFLIPNPSPEPQDPSQNLPQADERAVLARLLRACGLEWRAGCRPHRGRHDCGAAGRRPAWDGAVPLRRGAATQRDGAAPR
eukprot:scaffold62344_cov36-Phaeocystis_antarctica.AAC.1